MALLVDPRTGEQFEGPDENVAAAQKQFGLVTPEAYAEQQRQAQLQTEHGTLGEEFKTGGEQALTAAAAPLGAIAAPEDVDAMGNPTALSPIPVSPEAAARAEANPKAAFVGKLAGSLPEYAALGAAAGGLGAGLGAAPLATVALTNTVLGTTQEVASSNEETRPIDVGNIAKNIAFGAILEGAGYGGAKLLGRVGEALGYGEESAVKQAVQRSIDRAGVAGEDLGNPLVRDSSSATMQVKINDTANQLADAVAEVKPVVANNVVAQRSALRSAAEANPEIADELEAAVKRPGPQRFQAIMDLRDAAESPKTQEALDALVTDRSLWGDAAVEHANAMHAIGTANAQGPEALVEAARSIKDPTVQELVAKLDSHFDDKSAIKAAEVFGNQNESTVGAASSGFTDNTWDKARSELVAGGKQSDVAAATLAYEAPAIRTDAANQAARAFQVLDDTMKNELGVGAKYADWDAAAEKWKPSQIKNQQRWMTEQRASMIETSEALDKLREEGFDGQGFAARAKKTLASYQTRLDHAGDPVERAKLIDMLKRDIGGQIAGLSSASDRTLQGPIRQEMMNTLKPFYESLRTGLEDVSLWGRKMASYQRDANGALHEGIPALGRLFQDVGDNEGVVWGETGQGARIWRADPAKVETKLAGSLGGGINHQEDLQQAMKTINEMIAAKEAHGIKTVNLRAAKAALQSIENAHEMASLLRVAENQTVHRAQQLGHVGSGISTGGAVAASGVIHAAEFIGRAHGVPLGNIVRSTGGYTKLGRLFTKVGEAFGGEAPLPFGAKGSAVDTAVRDFAHGAIRQVGDLHGQNYYSSEVLGRAPEYTKLLREQGGKIGHEGEALRRAAGGSGGPGEPPPGAASKPPMRPLASTRAVGESVAANEGESAAAVASGAESPAMAEARAKVEAIRAKQAQAGYVVLGERSALPKEGELGRKPGVSYQARTVDRLPSATFDLPQAPKQQVEQIQDSVTDALRDRTPEERRAINAWRGESSSHMRASEKGLLPEDSRLPALQKALDRTTIANPTEHGPLYRAMPATPEMVDELLNHDELVISANSSASFDPDVARGFMDHAKAREDGGRGVMFKIDKADSGSIDPESGEAEVILRKGGKFRITDRQRLPNGALLVTVKQTGEASPADMAHLGSLGYAETGIGEGLKGIASSPLGITVGAGALGLGAHKAYQLAQDYPDDQHARYLASAGARDTSHTARALTDPAAASEFARRSAGAPSTLELFQGDHATLQQAFTEQRGLIERTLRDPGSLVDKLAEAFNGLSPGLRDALAAKAMQIATYLHAQLPPQRGVSVTRPNGLPPSSLEARSYALKFMTATQPSTAFDDAKRGTLRHEQVDTLKETWPEQYNDLRSQTLEAMTAGKSTILQRQRADLLFGFSTALDPAFSTRLSAAAAAARRDQSQSQGAPSGAPAKSRVTQNMQPGGIAALSA